MKDRGESKGKLTSVEGGVLTGVAQKVGTAVGTVVAAISRVSGPGSKKTKRMSASNNSHSGAKPSRRRSKTQPGKAGTERSPLKRRRMRSK
jgi:hypothetical protein